MQSSLLGYFALLFFFYYRHMLCAVSLSIWYVLPVFMFAMCYMYLLFLCLLCLGEQNGRKQKINKYYYFCACVFCAQ